MKLTLSDHQTRVLLY